MSLPGALSLVQMLTSILSLRSFAIDLKYFDLHALH